MIYISSHALGSVCNFQHHLISVLVQGIVNKQVPSYDHLLNLKLVLLK